MLCLLAIVEKVDHVVIRSRSPFDWPIHVAIQLAPSFGRPNTT
ncbi:Hypothetical protein A7982_10541 [Minicystis rosea]|nr:Hypothetical protein A7982_10541 [Minicystis rosea]